MSGSPLLHEEMEEQLGARRAVNDNEWSTVSMKSNERSHLRKFVVLVILHKTVRLFAAVKLCCSASINGN